jgi:hypothetical protein
MIPLPQAMPKRKWKSQIAVHPSAAGVQNARPGQRLHGSLLCAAKVATLLQLAEPKTDLRFFPGMAGGVHLDWSGLFLRRKNICDESQVF